MSEVFVHATELEEEARKAEEAVCAVVCARNSPMPAVSTKTLLMDTLVHCWLVVLLEIIRLTPLCHD